MVVDEQHIEFLIYKELRKNNKFTSYRGFDVTNQREADVKISNETVGVFVGSHITFNVKSISNTVDVYVPLNPEDVIVQESTPRLTVHRNKEDFEYSVLASYNVIYQKHVGSSMLWTEVFGNVFLPEKHQLQLNSQYRITVGRSQDNVPQLFTVKGIPKLLEVINPEFANKFIKYTNSIVTQETSKRETNGPSHSSSFGTTFQNSVIPIPNNERHMLSKHKYRPGDKDFLKNDVQRERRALIVQNLHDKVLVWTHSYGLVPYLVSSGNIDVDIGTWYSATFGVSDPTPEIPTGIRVKGLHEVVPGAFETYVEDDYLYASVELSFDPVLDEKKNCYINHPYFKKIGCPREKPGYLGKIVDAILVYDKENNYWVLDNITSNAQTKDTQQNNTYNASQTHMHPLSHSRCPTPSQSGASYSSPTHSRYTTSQSNGVFSDNRDLCYGSTGRDEYSDDMYNNFYEKRINHTFHENRNRELACVQDRSIKRSSGFIKGVIAIVDSPCAIVFNTNHKTSVLKEFKNSSLELGDVIEFEEIEQTPSMIGCNYQIIKNSIVRVGKLPKIRVHKQSAEVLAIFSPNQENSIHYLYCEDFGFVSVGRNSSVFTRVLTWLKNPVSPLKGVIRLWFDLTINEYIWLLVDVEMDMTTPIPDSLFADFCDFWTIKQVQEALANTNHKLFVKLSNFFNTLGL